jgi:cell division protein FtsI/penicillin-binding protein 2
MGKLNMDTYSPLGRIIVEPVGKEGFREVDDARLMTLAPKSKERNIIEQAAIGHGDTLATPVGVAHYFAYIGASALGAKDIAYPHLVKGIYDIKGRRLNELANVSPTTIPIKMSKEKSKKLIGFMESSGKNGGTAARAYKKVFGAPCSKNCFAAGKTGTKDTGKKEDPFLYNPVIS